jgi:hypothetical protein
MKTIFTYIRRYFYEVDKRLLIFCTVMIAILIYLNYTSRVDDMISEMPDFLYRFLSRYAVYLIAFLFPYIAYSYYYQRKIFRDPGFLTLLLIAPAIFSLKAGLIISLSLSVDPAINSFWNHILYWPLLLMLVLTLVYACWRIWDPSQPFYGIGAGSREWKPYWIMLLVMAPLIALASTQHDFLAVYPKLNMILQKNPGWEVEWWHKVIFELSYGSDFVGIEFFFRGFLVLAFMRWAGKEAVLPMACFYCTIHFGKPLGECISSYFGGLLLGVVIANTRSVWGGLMVHLGIAWMMELGGYIGESLSK